LAQVITRSFLLLFLEHADMLCISCHSVFIFLSVACSEAGRPSADVQVSLAPNSNPAGSARWGDLSRCSLVTSASLPDPSNMILKTPDVLVFQDKPVSSAGIVHRYLTFLQSDGSCREEGSLTLQCEGSADGARAGPDICSELGAPAGCMAAARQKCSLVAPPLFIDSELAAGLLGGAHPTIEDGQASLRGQPQKAQPTRHLKVLMLGTGAGGIPTYIASRFPSSSVTSVDIDPNVLFAAQHAFHSPLENLHFQLGDAGVVLQSQADQSLDAIYIDAYDPADNAPNMLYNRTSMDTARKKLRAGGHLVHYLVHADANRSANEMKQAGFNEVSWSEGSNDTQSYPMAVGRAPGGLSTVGSEMSAEILAELSKWQSLVPWHSTNM